LGVKKSQTPSGHYLKKLVCLVLMYKPPAIENNLEHFFLVEVVV